MSLRCAIFQLSLFGAACSLCVYSICNDPFNRLWVKSIYNQNSIPKWIYPNKPLWRLRHRLSNVRAVAKSFLFGFVVLFPENLLWHPMINRCDCWIAVLFFHTHTHTQTLWWRKKNSAEWNTRITKRWCPWWSIMLWNKMLSRFSI